MKALITPHSETTRIRAPSWGDAKPRTRIRAPPWVDANSRTRRFQNIHMCGFKSNIEAEVSQKVIQIQNDFLRGHDSQIGVLCYLTLMPRRTECFKIVIWIHALTILTSWFWLERKSYKWRMFGTLWHVKSQVWMLCVSTYIRIW